MGFSKNLNKGWKKENNLFSPLNIFITGKTKKSYTLNYLLNFDLNDIIFSNIYNVLYSTINMHFPIGKRPEYKWDIKAYFNYKEPGTPFSLSQYQFQTFYLYLTNKL